MNTAVQTNAPRVDLSRFDRAARKEAKRGKAAASNELADGKFDVRIEDVALYTSQRSGNPVLKYTLRILGPTNAGQSMVKYRAITDNTVSYVREELQICGVELGRFAELQERLPDLIGVELEVTRRTKGEDVNIYFNSVREAEEAEDDLPF